MIELFSGTPGSGKSYNALRQVLNYLGSGRYVISNFAIKFTEKQKKKCYHERFYYMSNDEITINNLIEFALDHSMIDKHQENQCLVVIDEAGGRFNCRDFANSDRAEWIDFFSQHRKAGFTFILVAQNDRMIDRQIRGLIEVEYKHRCVNRFGPFWMLPFKFFVSVEYWYPVKQRVGSNFFFLNKKIANQYDHMKMFTGFKISKALLQKIDSKKRGEVSPIFEGHEVSIESIYTDKDIV